MSISFALDCGHCVSDQERIKKFLEDKEYLFEAGGRTWPEQCTICNKEDCDEPPLSS